MIRTLFLTLIALPILLNGQTTDNLSKKPSKVLIGLNFSPEIGYRTLSGDAPASLSPFLNELRDSEQPNFGFTSGINVLYNFSKRVGLEIGAQYSKKGYAYKPDNPTLLIFANSTDPRTGFGFDPNSPSLVKFNYSFNYIDLPVRAIFNFGKNRIHFISSIGFTTNILVRASTTSFLSYPDGETEKNTNSDTNFFQRFNISGTISAGIGYDINEKLTMNIEPTFRHQLLSIIDASIKERLWNSGINLTFYYRLK